MSWRAPSAHNTIKMFQNRLYHPAAITMQYYQWWSRQHKVKKFPNPQDSLQPALNIWQQKIGIDPPGTPKRITPQNFAIKIVNDVEAKASGTVWRGTMSTTISYLLWLPGIVLVSFVFSYTHSLCLLLITYPFLLPLLLPNKTLIYLLQDILRFRERVGRGICKKERKKRWRLTSSKISSRSLSLRYRIQSVNQQPSWVLSLKLYKRVKRTNK